MIHPSKKASSHQGAGQKQIGQQRKNPKLPEPRHGRESTGRGGTRLHGPAMENRQAGLALRLVVSTAAGNEHSLSPQEAATEPPQTPLPLRLLSQSALCPAQRQRPTSFCTLPPISIKKKTFVGEGRDRCPSRFYSRPACNLQQLVAAVLRALT